MIKKQTPSRRALHFSVQALIGAASPLSKTETSPKRELNVWIIILMTIHFCLCSTPRPQIPYSLHNQSPRGFEEGFVKAAVKIFAAYELNRPRRVPDKGSQHPGY